MDPAEAAKEAQSHPALGAYRKILISGGPRMEIQKDLSPHQVLLARNLESSFECVHEDRPDLILYFAQGSETRLEEHVMTWLIEGFRGKIILLDSKNRVEQPETLLAGQVIDDYVSGPVSPSRFVALIKSHLALNGRTAEPHALTTFDLFRNLFERGINAIFFFSEDLERCLAANLAAEQLTGRSLYELRQGGLSMLCESESLDETARVIRRAARHYYDVKGNTVLNRRDGTGVESAFSCSWMNFGRSRVVKMEVQTPLWRRRDDPRAVNRAVLMGAVDESLKESEKGGSSLSVLVFKVMPGQHGAPPSAEAAALGALQRVLKDCIRQNDTLVRLSEHQFGVLLPKTEEDRAKQVLERVRKKIAAVPQFGTGGMILEARSVHCPPEGFSFLNLLMRGV